MNLFQCVPNFSEGRRSDVVEKIVMAMCQAAPVSMADYSSDVDHNRSVVTLVGTAPDIQAAMLAGARTAVELIDMNQHEGVHPRIGAVDVIPVVPLGDSTMDEAVALAHKIGQWIASELDVPVYFYEDCALRDHCANLADVRKGGYEGLKAGKLTGKKAPDLGPHELHPTAGATVVGARGPLVAYNINLATGNVDIAQRIAAEVRRLRDSGEGMEGVKAIGLYLASRGIAQVSFNLTKPDATGIWEVYSFVEAEARAEGVDILESELIGALSEQFLVDAARKAMRFTDLGPERVLEHWMRRSLT